MEDYAAKIWRITPNEALRLEEEGKGGNAEALKDFIFYSVWKNIDRNRTIPARQKPKLFRLLLKHARIDQVDYVAVPAAAAETLTDILEKYDGDHEAITHMEDLPHG